MYICVNLSFLLGCSVGRHIIVPSHLLCLFVFLWCQLQHSLFISDFLYLGVFFIFMSPSESLLILFPFSKDQLLVSLCISPFYTTLCYFSKWSFPSLAQAVQNIFYCISSSPMCDLISWYNILFNFCQINGVFILSTCGYNLNFLHY